MFNFFSLPVSVFPLYECVCSYGFDVDVMWRRPGPYFQSDSDQNKKRLASKEKIVNTRQESALEKTSEDECVNQPTQLVNTSDDPYHARKSSKSSVLIKMCSRVGFSTIEKDGRNSFSSPRLAIMAASEERIEVDDEDDADVAAEDDDDDDDDAAAERAFFLPSPIAFNWTRK